MAGGQPGADDGKPVLDFVTTPELMGELQKRFRGSILVLESDGGNFFVTTHGGKSMALGLNLRLQNYFKDWMETDTQFDADQETCDNSVPKNNAVDEDFDDEDDNAEQPH